MVNKNIEIVAKAFGALMNEHNLSVIDNSGPNNTFSIIPWLRAAENHSENS